MPRVRRPRIVIVGAGFGGLRAAQALARSSLEVWVLDRNNYHTFNPMLYQVATGMLAPEQIAYPVRGLLRGWRNVNFAKVEVQQIDCDRRVVITDGPSFRYDFLILATGSITRFLEVPGAANHAFTLDNLEQAVVLRNQILSCFERAVCEPDHDRRRQLLTFVVVGGGPTGVELAGALAELIRGPLRRDFSELDLRQVRVVLLQAGDRLLSEMPPAQQRYARHRLRRMGVEVCLGATASQVTEEAVLLHDNRLIPTCTVIWTVGVHVDPRVQQWGFVTAAKGQITVLPTLQVLGYPEVYGVGDLSIIDSRDKSLPMVAPAAIQQGLAAAKNIQRQIKGRQPAPFKYWNKGTISIIGRNAAAAQVGRLNFTGFPAWLLWLGVHLVYLPGWYNRLVVLLSWLVDYGLHRRSIRHILGRGYPAQHSWRQVQETAIAGQTWDD